jgi:Protein of unknown function (DUF1207)
VRIPRPTPTLIPALLIAAAVFPASTRGDDGSGWRATRDSKKGTAAPIANSPSHRSTVTSEKSGDSPSQRAGGIEPITFHPDQQPAVSTWSKIRRAAAAKSSPFGTEWPPSQTAGISESSGKTVNQIVHVEAANPLQLPPDLTVMDDCREPDFTWQVLPAGLLYRSYMAGVKEARLGTVALRQSGGDTFQESTLGARVGIVRYGTPTAIRPEGWELDVEGAAFLRQNWDENLDVEAVDFRYGVPLTWRRGPWAAKFAFYHLSSHAGDEFLIRNPGFQRINYLRDVLLLGVSYNVTPDWRVYGEVGYAVHTDAGAEPWELQFGAEYSPIVRNGIKGSPFFAVNGYLRQDFDFGGSLNVMFGWQWRSDVSDHVFRIGGQYYNGKSLQFEFFNRNEQLFGGGVWYDF